MSKVHLSRWQLFKARRRDSQFVENFQGLMPLPSIRNKDACLCNSNKDINRDMKVERAASGVLHRKGNKLDPKQQTTKLLSDSERHDTNVGDNAISSKLSGDSDHRNKSSKYKWKRTAADTMSTCLNSSFSDASKETSSQSLNLKESHSLQKLTSLRQRATISSNKTKLQEENPSFIIRNSRCIRHLPPLNTSQENSSPFARPSCPSPVSPPPTPTH